MNTTLDQRDLPRSAVASTTPRCEICGAWKVLLERKVQVLKLSQVIRMSYWTCVAWPECRARRVAASAPVAAGPARISDLYPVDNEEQPTW